MTLGIYWPLLWALNVALPLSLMMAFAVTGAMLCGGVLWLAIRWEGGSKKVVAKVGEPPSASAHIFDRQRGRIWDTAGASGNDSGQK